MSAFSFDVSFFSFGNLQTSGIADLQSPTGFTVGGSFTPVSAPVASTIRINDDDFNLAPTFDDGFRDQPGSGQPPQAARNDQRLDQPITLDGVDYHAGQQVELEFAFEAVSDEATPQTYTFWTIHIGGQNVGIGGPVLPAEGVTYTIETIFDGLRVPVTPLPCFTVDALIDTPDGPRRVGDIAVGDPVMTRDHGPQPVRWVGRRAVSAAEMLLSPALRPVRFRPDALGPGRPLRTMDLSPEHRVLLADWQTEVLTGEAETLVPARAFLGRAGVAQALPAEGVTYVHLMFDRHEIVTVDGVPSESFRADEQGLAAVGPAARDEILRLFPELAAAPARPVLTSVALHLGAA